MRQAAHLPHITGVAPCKSTKSAAQVQMSLHSWTGLLQRPQQQGDINIITCSHVNLAYLRTQRSIGGSGLGVVSTVGSMLLTDEFVT